jgi:hypothetical protein
MSEFSETIMEEWERLRKERTDVSLWDAFTSLLKERIPSYLLTLRADMDVIRYIAQGYNISAIHRMTGIPSKAIRKVAFTWGMEPLEQTLDFNAILMYNRDTTADILYRRMNDFLATPLPYETYETVIHNIEKYFDLEKFLREEEEHGKQA